MKKYTKMDPVFNKEIMITETGDPGHADNINAAPKQIFENTLANRKEIMEGNSENRTVTFSNSDTKTVNEWTDIPVLESGETHKSLLGKISIVFKNMRYLYKVLGSADLSEMDDGTVTGVLAALKLHCFVDPVDSLLANIKGKSLDANQGPVIQGQIDELKEKVGEINSNLTPKLFKTHNILLNDLEWIESSNGKYYANIDLAIPDHKIILSFYIYDWGILKNSDIIQPYINIHGVISIMSNVNIFDTNAGIRLAIAYI